MQNTKFWTALEILEMLNFSWISDLNFFILKTL